MQRKAQKSGSLTSATKVEAMSPTRLGLDEGRVGEKTGASRCGEKLGTKVGRPLWSRYSNMTMHPRLVRATRHLWRPLAGGLALALVACGGTGPAPASQRPPEPLPEKLGAAGKPCPAPAPLVADPQALITGYPLGNACGEGVCPQYYACTCDAEGRVLSLEHTYGGVPRDRTWLTYDSNGHLREARRDHEADGRIDVRSVLSRNDDATCIVEARDDDADGTVETLCAYEGECMIGAPSCQPKACTEATTEPSGRWCEPKSCPTAGRCACDERGRISQAFFNHDGDPAFEARTDFVYRDEDNHVDEKRWSQHGFTTYREELSYDQHGHLIRRAADGNADGTIDSEERWSYEPGSDHWTWYEEWRAGALAMRRTRSYRDGKPLTETLQFAGGELIESRYFPGASSDVVQPVVVSSSLISQGENRCQRDADCTIVHGVGCCDCSSGGRGIVVAKRFAAALRRKVARACKDRNVCLAVISSDPTCEPGVTPACIEELCTLRRH